MRTKNLTKAGVLACTIATLSASTNVFADADIAVQPTGMPLEATTNVDLCVVVPRVLIFGVGANAGTVAKLTWTHGNAAGVTAGNNQTYSGTSAPFTAPAPLVAGATAAVTSGGGTGASASGNTAQLPVYLFSNSGADVEITTTVTGAAGGLPAGSAGTTDALDHATLPGATIPITLFTAGSGANIPQPVLASGSSATTAHSSGIVNLADTWTYQYTPAATPPTGGTYEARVTYVATTP